jgi:hypothetical protein
MVRPARIHSLESQALAYEITEHASQSPRCLSMALAEPTVGLYPARPPVNHPLCTPSRRLRATGVTQVALPHGKIYSTQEEGCPDHAI